MPMKTVLSLSAALAALAPETSNAQNTFEMLAGQVEATHDGGLQIDIHVLNTGKESAAVQLPESVGAQITSSGASVSERTVTLKLTDPSTAAITVDPGHFGTASYTWDKPLFEAGSLLSIPLWGRLAVPLRVAAQEALMAEPNYSAHPIGPTQAAPPPTNRTVDNAFVENLSVHEPIYAVYGPDTDSEARIQISFKYQLFGHQVRNNVGNWLNGFHFAYTQRIFWDVGANSSPFRNIDFQPEIFYATKAKSLSNKTTLSAQVGFRHESNGRDGELSRSFNTIYLAPMAAFTLKEGIRLTVAPRAWLYAGDISDNPDIERYRGNTGLFLEIGDENGLRISTSNQYNFSSDKGAIAADISYPLRNILGGGPDFYLFGQGFAGFGENLLDYNRKMKRLRIGVALVR